MKTLIIFYHMAGCGFCSKAMQAYKPEIDEGVIEVKDASEAGGKFSGFPAFEAVETGKTHTGFVPDVEALFEKLGIKKEGFGCSAQSDEFEGFSQPHGHHGGHPNGQVHHTHPHHHGPAHHQHPHYHGLPPRPAYHTLGNYNSQ